MGTTVRRIGPAQGGNRIVIRQGDYYRPDMQTSATDLKRLEGKMRKKFEARFPQFADVRFQYSWSGHLCVSKNGVSVMRELEPGLFSACECNGLGTARGTRTYEMKAFFLAEDDPVKLPPHPFDTIGANVYMRLKEW